MVLRPIRDDLGIINGVENLPWLFTGTLLTTAAVTPLYGYLVKHLSRHRLVVISYRVFSTNLLAFAWLFSQVDAGHQAWVGRFFFVWVSVFNLFVISMFWSFAADMFDRNQGKRLFGLLSAGATLGGLLGALITSTFIAQLGRTGLILIAIGLLEVAVLAATKCVRLSDATLQPRLTVDDSHPRTSTVFSGLLQTLRSPYLLGLACFILIYSLTSTFLYYQQASIAQSHFTDSASRTAFFARIDLWVSAITLFIQLFITGRLMAALGIVLTLCALPVVSLIGFTGLTSCPTIGVLITAQVARRVVNFALARPAREVLFTSIPPADRHKAKQFIDTVLYRAGDQCASWGAAGLLGLGLGISQVGLLGVPLSALWLLLSVWLGRSHIKQERQREQEEMHCASVQRSHVESSA